MGLEKIEKEQRKKKEANKKLMNGLATQKENKICADCLERRVNFANITHGVFLCKQCAEIHCNLVSKTRIKALGEYDTFEDDGLFI